MILEYKIEEEDYLAFQLYTASQSAAIQKKKTNSHILITSALALLGLIMISVSADKTFGFLYLILAIVFGVYYPKYFKWRYKKHYLGHIRESYKQRIGLMVSLEFLGDTILAKDKTGESKLALSEIEIVKETAKHFFIQFSTGVSVIIPKQDDEEVNALKQKFQEAEIVVEEHLSWKW